MGQNTDFVISGGESLLETLADYCLRTGAEELLEQWDATRNLPLTPAKLSHGSKQKVWWECPLGHVWKAVVYSRTSSKKCGCPICSGRVSRKRLERYQAMLAQSKEDARML